MRHIGVILGAILLTILSMAVRLRMGWHEGIGIDFGMLCLWTTVALILSKTVLTRQSGRHLPFDFREIIITGSLIFGTIVSNVSIQMVQMNVFGHTYVSSDADPEPDPGSTKELTPPGIAEKMATTFVGAAGEELAYRWIILGALLMVISPVCAIFISSLIFAGLHTVVPIMGGIPYAGLASLGPTFVIGLFCGVAFVRYGLTGSIAVHFIVNLITVFAYNHTYIADTITFGSATIALIVLPITLWLTRKKTWPRRATV